MGTGCPEATRQQPRRRAGGDFASQRQVDHRGEGVVEKSRQELYELEITGTPKRRLTHRNMVIIHVEEIVEANHGLTDFLPRHDPGPSLSRKRRRHSCSAGRIDGTGPPPFRDGAHSFLGASGRGRAGGSGFSTVKTEF